MLVCVHLRNQLLSVCTLGLDILEESYTCQPLISIAASPVAIVYIAQAALRLDLLGYLGWLMYRLNRVQRVGFQLGRLRPFLPFVL